VAQARATNQTWPFVTIPSFAIRATKARLQSDAFCLQVYPLVTKEQRPEWEKYSLANQGWVNESMKVQEHDEFYYGPVWYNHSISETIYGDRDYEANVSMPSWQTSPSKSTNLSRFPAPDGITCSNSPLFR
jgi:hypothetical protein